MMNQALAMQSIEDCVYGIIISFLLGITSSTLLFFSYNFLGFHSQPDPSTITSVFVPCSDILLQCEIQFD